MPYLLKVSLVAAAVFAAGALLLTAYSVGTGGEPEDPFIARDRMLYRESCASCHGSGGEGAPNWKVPDPETGAYRPPPHDSSGHTWHHPDGLLLRIVRDGCDAFPASDVPCVMPAFGEVYDDYDIRSVIEFLKTMWGPEERAFQAEVSLQDPF